MYLPVKVFFTNEFPSLPKKVSIILSSGKKKLQISNSSYIFQMFVVAKLNYLLKNEAITLPTTKKDQSDLVWVTLSKSDIKYLDIDPRNYLRDLRKIRDELKSLELEVKVGRTRIWTNLAPGDWIITTDEITVPISTALLPYFKPATEVQYTQYLFDNIKKFRSQYSVPLYNEFSTYIHSGQNSWKTGAIDVDYLKYNVCGIEKGKYEQFGLFKLKIIDPAIKDINDHGHINVTVDERVKSGRKITALKFLIERKDAIQQDFDFEEEYEIIPDNIRSLLESVNYKLSGKAEQFIVDMIFENSEQLVELSLKELIAINVGNESYIPKILKDELPKIIKKNKPAFEEKAAKEIEKQEHNEKIQKWKNKNPYESWKEEFYNKWEISKKQLFEEFGIESPKPTEKCAKDNWEKAAENYVLGDKVDIFEK